MSNNTTELLEHASSLIDELEGTITAKVLENLIDAQDYEALYHEVQSAQAAVDAYEKESI